MSTKKNHCCKFYCFLLFCLGLPSESKLFSKYIMLWSGNGGNIAAWKPLRLYTSVNFTSGNRYDYDFVIAEFIPLLQGKVRCSTCILLRATQYLCDPALHHLQLAAVSIATITVRRQQNYDLETTFMYVVSYVCTWDIEELQFTNRRWSWVWWTTIFDQSL